MGAERHPAHLPGECTYTVRWLPETKYPVRSTRMAPKEIPGAHRSGATWANASALLMHMTSVAPRYYSRIDGLLTKPLIKSTALVTSGVYDILLGTLRLGCFNAYHGKSGIENN